MFQHDRVIVAAILALGLVIAALSVASARLGPTIDSLNTAEFLDGTLVNSQIAITFTQPMRPQTVQRSFRITPRVKGDFSWSGSQLRFIPTSNLTYATTYRITIGTGSQDASGRHLSKVYRATFTTQSEHLVYIGTAGSERDRLVLASTSGKRQIIGPGDSSIAAFSPSFDRSLLAYVKRGSKNERPDEIWLLSLADNSAQKVFRHEDWGISQPRFSPDNRYIAFLATNVRLCRKYYGCFRDARPQIYLLDLRSHRVFPFRSSGDLPITNFIAFSPRGQIAFTDLGSALTLADPDGRHVVHIPNLGNSPEFAGLSPGGDKALFVGATPASTGGDILMFSSGKYTDVSRGVYDSSVPAFSSSGTQIAYSAYRGERGIEPVYSISAYSLRTRLTRYLTGKRMFSDWAPQWSPSDRFVAFVRSEPQEAMYMGSGEVWVVRSDGSHALRLGGIGTSVRWVL